MSLIISHIVASSTLTPPQLLKIIYSWSHSARAFFCIPTSQNDKLFQVTHIQFNLFNVYLDCFPLILKNYCFSELKRKACSNMRSNPQKYKNLERRILSKN